MAVKTETRARQALSAVTVTTNDVRVQIPESAADLDGFLRWLESGGIPDGARVWFVAGDIWVDLSMEQIFTHVDLKTEIATVLRTLVKAGRLGRLLGDGARLIHRGADLSGEPDAMFVSAASLAAGRVTLVDGKDGGTVALEGTPDMVLEVVSDSSERKDNQVLLEAYWEAGIPEYWLVDARGAELEFDVFRRGAKKYAAARKAEGWAKSAVFGKAFRLTRGADPQGNPEFTLEVR